ncbi:MAG: alpha/beta hydrolase [Alphaproteobacteria bacterium]|mgnify:CR=1 FL=1|jgi:pimeloyl-ACP methyl ester carboxylesterase|nr:alpha/beta hydrolase [Alphaproteobacteria bacterium]MBT5389605.1 alpha/beta hydrolase [Alphaproteobacteria bacterium]MBT5540169.1 alpha/beta hydrolase [Alphaproteobacteria bacterium]MBT5654554.1 alpha/beta hydrolase [Alphaproteobacteria bacterium]
MGNTNVKTCQENGGTFYVETLSGIKSPSLRLVWLPGWAQNRNAFTAFQPFFEKRALNHFVDCPGFGEAPVPPSDWGTEDYAQGLSQWLSKEPSMPTIIIGHSFGGRVALQLANLYPELVQGLVLIAGAGLKRPKPLRIKLKIFRYKILAKAVSVFDRLFGTHLLQKLRTSFGSTDYKRSGPLRNILVKTVNEDLSTVAASITQPTLLIYGEKDTETPPEYGERFQKLIANAQLHRLPLFDHYSILAGGRSQVTSLIAAFLEGFNKKDS